MNKETEKLEISELSREQILDLADAAGRKLGFLLATSPLTDEQKSAINNLLEFAAPEQIDKLTEILETGYLEAQNKDASAKFKTELEKIKIEFEQNIVSLNKNAFDKLKELESKVDKSALNS